jgi:uncharacterized membrane protein
MSKQEFLNQLKNKLKGLPEQDVNRSLEFYSEMIDERIEEGVLEENAVSDIGEVDEIASQILADTPITKLIKEKIKTKRKISAFEIVLLILGSPIWLSLLIAAFAVIILLYVSLWAIIISFWAVFVSLIACALGGIVSGITFACFSQQISGLATIGAGIVLGGISVFAFFGCKAATKGAVFLTKKVALCIKNCFVKKEEV